MRCERCGVEMADEHQCDPAIVEAREKAREQWRKEAEEDRKLHEVDQASKVSKLPRRKIPPASNGLSMRQRIGGAKTK